MGIKQTYQLEKGPPAVRFEDYEFAAARALEKLLEEDPAESEVQRFLELHPSFVPGARSPGGGTCTSRLFNLLISQPRLTGLDGRRPDFMWFASNSDSWFPVLLEIERPSKLVFRQDGVPCAEFTQASNQLIQWRTWFSEPTNQLKFQKDYGVPQRWTERKVMKPQMILIYGRREEFEHNPALTKHRATLLAGSSSQLMSFDRLAADPMLSDALTVCATRTGRYEALVVPPTIEIRPASTERFLVIEGLESAIDKTEGWTPERRRFVKSRLPYWQEWARSGRKGWIAVGDKE